MTATLTTKALAEQLGTTPRELRKFLRSDKSGITPVGKGARYTLPGTKPAIAKFKKNFASWDAAREAEKARIAQEKAEAAAALEAKVSEDQDESDTEPTEDELTDLLEDDNTDDEDEGDDTDD